MGSSFEFSWGVAIVTVFIIVIATYFALGGSKDNSNSKAAVPVKNKPKKSASSSVKTEKAAVAVPTPAPAPAAQKLVVSKAPVASPAPVPVLSPSNVAAAAPELSGSGSDTKLKKPKETPEQKEARLKRQQAAKLLKKESESSARTQPESNPIPTIAIKKAATDDDWEIVVDKKKDKPRKKLDVSEAPVSAVTQPVVAPVIAPVVEVKISRTVNVDSKRVGGVIGPKGVTLRSIQDATGVEIQIPKTESEKPTVSVSISGIAANVAKASKIISEIVDNGISVTLVSLLPQVANQPSVSVESSSAPVPVPVPVVVDLETVKVNVDSKKIGIIIGPKGATLHAIQNATQTELQTSTGTKSSIDTTVVSITGPSAGVAKAVKAVNELATKGYCLLLSGENFQESSITVPARFLAEIIGKSGATIRTIQDTTGVKVVIPPSAPRSSDSKFDDSAPIKIGLAGQRDGIANAKQIITQITELYYHPITHPGFVHVLADIPDRFYNNIIGVKGSEIRHIQNNFKVSVKIPDRNSVFHSVLVIGEQHNCDNAVKYMQKIVSQIESREQDNGATDQWGAKDEEENYDEDLMNRYVYSRQNRNRGDETASVPQATYAAAGAAPVQADMVPRRHPVSERPPGFSPMKEDDPEGGNSGGSVPLAWGAAAKAPLTW